MKALILTKNGEPDKKQIQDDIMPTPGPNEISIKITKAEI